LFLNYSGFGIPTATTSQSSHKCISDDKQINQAQSIITYSPFKFELFTEKSNDMLELNSMSTTHLLG